MADLDPQVQLPMFELATQGIEEFVSNLGRFTPFALATLNDGEIMLLETSGEFEDGESARDGLLAHLTSMKAQNQIIGCLVCCAVDVPGAQLQVAAVMEIEAAGQESMRTLRQILNDSEGPRLVDKVEFMPGLGKVFG